LKPLLGFPAQACLDSLDVFGKVDLGGIFLGDHDADRVPPFQGAKLFELFDFLQRAGGQTAKNIEKVPSVGINAQMLVNAVRAFGIPAKRDGGAGKIQGEAPPVDGDLDVLRICQFPWVDDSKCQGGHCYAGLGEQRLAHVLDVPRIEHRLVALHVDDHVVGRRGKTSGSLGDPIGARARRRRGHDGRTAECRYGVGNSGIVGGHEHLDHPPGPDGALVDPLDHRNARDRGKRLAGKTGRTVTARDDDKNLSALLGHHPGSCFGGFGAAESDHNHRSADRPDFGRGAAGNEMDREILLKLLQDVAEGRRSAADAARSLSRISLEDIDYAHIDHHRGLRKGFAEVIYGEGKTAEQIAGIMERMIPQERVVLVTRIDAEKAAAVLDRFPESVYHPEPRMLIWRIAPPAAAGRGPIAVVSAGTSDIPVAMESALTARAMGHTVETVFDVGVAGIHRLFEHRDVLERATVLVVAAGMEGALPSVVAGLVESPVIAVPTSIGYGTSFGGLTALMAMLNSCSPNVAVVNIDNGFGAGYMAAMINR